MKKFTGSIVTLCFVTAIFVSWQSFSETPQLQASQAAEAKVAAEKANPQSSKAKSSRKAPKGRLPNYYGQYCASLYEISCPTI